MKQSKALFEEIISQTNDSTIWANYFLSSNHLARTYIYLHEFKKSLYILNELLPLEEEKFGKNNRYKAESLLWLAVCHREMKKTEKAIEFHKKAIKVRSKIFGDTSINLAYNYLYLANSLLDIRKIDSALLYLNKALKIRVDFYDSSENIEVAMVEHSIGGVYELKRDFEKAELYYKKALNTRIKLEPKSIFTADSYNVMAKLLQRKGEFQKAESYFKEALRIRQEVLGTYHAKTLNCYNYLGRLAHMQGENNRAIEIYKQALSIIKDHYEANHRISNDFYGYIATAYYSMGDFRNAAKYDEKILGNILKKYKGKKSLNIDENLNLGLAYQYLATDYAEMGSYSKAEDLLLKSHEHIVRSNFPEQIFTSISNFGVLYNRMKDNEKAEKYFRLQMEYFEDFEIDSTLEAATLALNLGSVYYDKEDYELANLYFKKALSIRTKVLGEHQPATYKILGLLGSVQLRKNNYDEAKKILTKGLKLHSRH